MIIRRYKVVIATFVCEDCAKEVQKQFGGLSHLEGDVWDSEVGYDLACVRCKRDESKGIDRKEVI